MKLIEFKLLHHYGFPISLLHHPSTNANSTNEENQLINKELREYIKLIEDGCYLKVLQDIGKTFDIFCHNEHEEISSGNDIFKNITSYTLKKLEDLQENIIDILKLLLIAIASFSIFIQINITQPNICIPKWPFSNKIKNISLKELEIDGEDVIGKIDYCQYFLIAHSILVNTLIKNEKDSTYQNLNENKKITMNDKIKNNLMTWLIWSGRIVSMHQLILKHKSMTLYNELMFISDEIEDVLKDKFKNDKKIIAVIMIELIHWKLQYKMINGIDEKVKEIENILNISIEVTAAMGKRTLYQCENKAQMYIKINKHDEIIKDMDDLEIIKVFNEELSYSVDILDQPLYINNEENINEDLSAIEQCLILLHYDIVMMSRAKDELRSWESLPFVEKIELQKKSCFLIKLLGKLYKIRHEKMRNRTKERSLVTMENLLNILQNNSITNINQKLLNNRLKYIFMIRYPLLITLKYEMANQYISMGFISEAMEIYESYEMWDNLILCYCLLNKKIQADKLIMKRLEENPDDYKMICILGDLREDEALYIKSWEKSKYKYPRAQRAIAKKALGMKNYKKAIEAYEKALKINALFPDAWFSLGYCYLKIDDNDNALIAFTRCVQIDIENGEAWNNLGVLWMKKEKYHRSYWAFKEAIKYKHGSWETWENYAKACVLCDEYNIHMQGIYAMTKVIELTNGDKCSVEIINHLIEIENKLNSMNLDLTLNNYETFKNSLEQMLSKASEGSAWQSDHWIIYATFWQNRNHIQNQKNCLLKAFRKTINWKINENEFKKLSYILRELFEVSKQLNDNTMSSLKMQIKGILKQTKDLYAHLDTYQKLENTYQNLCDRYYYLTN